MNLDRVSAELSQRIDAMARREGSTLRELWRAALDVEHLILCDLLTPEEEAQVLDDSRVKAVHERSQQVFCRLETRIENSMAEFARAGGATALGDRGNITQNYLARYENLAGTEVALARITNRDHALFIGSGPLPITAVEYCWQTGCSVDCVDMDEDAFVMSTEIVSLLGLQDRMRCFHGPGQSFDPAIYDVVLVGVLAMPKQAILESLNLRTKAGCRVICRTTYGLRQLIYRGSTFDAGRLTRLIPAGKSVALGDRVISAELMVAK